MSPIHSYDPSWIHEDDPTQSDSREILKWNGPIIRVTIQPPSDLQGYLQEADPESSPVSGKAMVDTGATHSCVDREVAKSLKLPVRDEVQFSSVTGQDFHTVYSSWIQIPNLNGEGVYSSDSQSLVEVDLSTDNLIALIGNDVLSKFIFIYNGPAGHFTLSY